jgi:hypothetical protein
MNISVIEEGRTYLANYEYIEQTDYNSNPIYKLWSSL